MMEETKLETPLLQEDALTASTPPDANGAPVDNGATSSITQQALNEFTKPIYNVYHPNHPHAPQSWPYNHPVVIRDFGLRKSGAGGAGGAGGGGRDGAGSSAGENAGLKTAPNFASAILGSYLADKLGLSGRVQHSKVAPVAAVEASAVGAESEARSSIQIPRTPANSARSTVTSVNTADESDASGTGTSALDPEALAAAVATKEAALNSTSVAAAPPASSSPSSHVFQGVNAILHPGEGTLLLGPSSSGKTTFLRSLADILSGKTRDSKHGTSESNEGFESRGLEGHVTIGSLDPSNPNHTTMNLNRNVAFVDQSDLTLTPILTVEETIRFARECAENYDSTGEYQHSSNGDGGMSKEEFEKSLTAILTLAGLDHVRNTVVGNADIRGVSGGQKRRVKLLEMSVGSQVMMSCYDEISNGLDAASALSICKVIRAALQATNYTAITCLLQPSEAVYRTFDRLILLTPDGRVAYSGPIRGGGGGGGGESGEGGGEGVDGADAAVQHFESLGLKKPKEMNIPEFLLRCASSPMEFWDGEESGVPPESFASSANLAKAFNQSKAGQNLQEELRQIHDKFLPHSSTATLPNPNNNIRCQVAGPKPFAQPTSRQISLLVGRGWKLVKRNPASSMRVVSACIFGIFIGTLFLNTPGDEEGTFTRAGYVLTMIFLSFLNSCMSPLDDLFNDRITFYIHRRASFYRTASYYVSQMLCSWPVAMAEAFLLCVLSFFAVGMNGNGGWGFLYFWLQFTLVTLCGTAISRCLAYTLPSVEMGQSLGPAVLLLFIMSACFSPQYFELPAWLRWLAWISPCAYTFESVIVSETLRDVGSMNGQEYSKIVLGIPRIPYENAPNAMSSPAGIMIFDSVLLVALTIAFELIGVFVLHKSQDWYGPSTQRYQVLSGQSLSAPPWKGVNREKESFSETAAVGDGSSQVGGASSVPKAPSAHLTVKDIVYEVDIDPPAEETTNEDDPTEDQDLGENILDHDSDHGIPITAREYGQTGRGSAAEFMLVRELGPDALSSSSSSLKSSGTRQGYKTELEPTEPGRLRLLGGITASFEPGTLSALMGESGAGKSTLLDCIAGYKTGGHLSGDININGNPKTDETWRSLAGYCEQVDLHNPSMTVRESLIFAARMRLRPFTLPDAEKIAFATKIMNLLDLDEFADMLVGDEAAGEGLPKHARKRLTVGVELAANPSILFADEPTSGLDSLSAALVVNSLKKAAKIQGVTVICTIHQPSKEVFLAFDNLLLLRKGGMCCYNGSIADLNNYISSVDTKYEIAQGSNPADHALEVFCGPLGSKEDWADLYDHSPMAKDALESFQSSSSESQQMISIDASPQSFTSELYLVFQRQIVAHWRTPTYMALRFWWTIGSCLLTGLVYFQTSEKGREGVTNMIGAIFFYVNIATVPIFSAMVPLITERAVFYRETLSGTYRRLVYGFAVQLAELPFNLGMAFISFVIFYFLVGLTIEGERIVYFILMALASYWLLPAVGQLFAFLSPNIGAAVGIGSLLVTLLTLTMGFLISPNNIPPWYIWIYWLNPLRYILQGLVVNELGDKDPLYDEMLEQLGWSYGDRWWYCYVVTVLFALASSVTIVLSTRISWLKR